MLSLKDYILEEKILHKDNVFVWNYAQFDGWDDNKVLAELKEQLIQFQLSCIVTMVGAAKDKIEKDEKEYPEKLRNAAIKASKEYKSFANMSDDKKEKWILNKIEEIKKNAELLTKDNGSWKHLVKNSVKVPLIVPPTKIENVTIGLDNFRILVHNDIHSQQSSREIKWDSSNMDELSKNIFDAFPNTEEFKEHFRGFAIYTDQKNISKFDSIHITFMFDDEFEDKLDKDVKKFADFMQKEYQSGRYMGD